MGTAAVVAHCALAGVEMVRIHDVREIRQVTDVCAALRKTLDEPTPPTTSRSL
jgi:dihydropteroate synthase